MVLVGLFNTFCDLRFSNKLSQSLYFNLVRSASKKVVHNVKNDEAHFFLYHEGQAKEGPNGTHSFILKYLNEYVRELHLYSDTCGGSSTRNGSGHVRPKHRGCKVQDGHYVQAGTILVLQRTLRFHPGLNVGFGKNGTLFAMEPGRVMITCEEADLNWEHSWVKRHYGGRENQKLHKKYFNVIPEPQERRFKLIDKI